MSDYADTGTSREGDPYAEIAALKQRVAELERERDELKAELRRAVGALVALVASGEGLLAYAQRKCAWARDEAHDKYDTACGNAWQFTAGDVAENRVEFCPYCGGLIDAQDAVVKALESVDLLAVAKKMRERGHLIVADILEGVDATRPACRQGA